MRQGFIRQGYFDIWSGDELQVVYTRRLPFFMALPCLQRVPDECFWVHRLYALYVLSGRRGLAVT